jgi:hypothetical protein
MLHTAIPQTLSDESIGRPHTSQLAIVDDDGQADQVSSASEAVEPAPRYINSVDATTGQPLVARVMTRKHELEAALEALPVESVRERSDLDLALATIGEMLTGDLSHVPAIVSADMNRWLERTKHLAEKPVVVAATDSTAVPAEPTLAQSTLESYSDISG